MATRTSRAKRTSRQHRDTSKSPGYVCSDCGRPFATPQALGAHRRQAHGVTGSSKRSQARAAAAARPASRTGSSAATPSSATGARRNRRATSAAANANSGRRGQRGSVDRDALLAALFPVGIPAREDVIRELADWLDQAERLATAR
jgi:hypothetical protein